MRALITGIEGFVGKYLSDHLLAQGDMVCGTYLTEGNLSNLDTRVECFQMDITDATGVKKVLLETEPDVIYHLAAQSSAGVSWKKPQMTVQVNVIGTLNILEFLRMEMPETRILLIGSSEEYGYVKPEDMPVSEDQPYVPGNPYAISKIGQSMFGKLYARAYGLDVIMIKAFNHFGPGQSDTFVISDFAKRIAMIEKGLMKPVLKVGNLEAERDFTDVRDVVRAYRLLADRGEKGEMYNVGSGSSRKIQDILDLLLSFVDVDVQMIEDSGRMRPSDVPVIRCDHRKLCKSTGWEPKHKFKESVLSVLEHWRTVV